LYRLLCAETSVFCHTFHSLEPGIPIQKKQLLLILRVSVAVGAFAWVLGMQDWARLTGAFRKLTLGAFGMALLVFVLAQIVVALRWWILMRAQHVQLPILTAVHLHFLGLFFNNLMPSSVGGDFLRAWYVTKHTEKRFEAALTVFVDRAVGLFGILVMALVSYVFLMRGLALDTIVSQEGGTAGDGVARFVGYTCLAIVFLLVLVLLLSGRTRRFLANIWASKRGTLSSLLLKTKRVGGIYWSRPWPVILALSFTLVIQAATIITLWGLGRSIGMEAPAKYYFVIFPVMWVVAALPVSIAGIGVLEGGLSLLFVSWTGASSEQATCLALCQRFIWILASCPGVVIHLSGGHLPKPYSFDVEPKAEQHFKPKK
jgi:uncharacterized protein (TIRG00374 family)